MKIRKIFLAFIMLLLVVLTTSCGKTKTFGEFGYLDNWLTDYAVKEVDATTLKKTLGELSKNSTSKTANTSDVLANAGKVPTPSEELVDEIIDKYAQCDITTLYYVSESDDQQSYPHSYIGTDFKDMIETNSFIPFSQVVCKNVILFDELIDYMEAVNTEFKNSEISKVAPFKNMFTYHLDENGLPIVQLHDFSEIPSSYRGGVGCCFRQDIEIMYDAEGKVTKWQSSLGVYSSSPTGTVKQGYIVEIDFNWIIKE